jgi:3-oxoadipate enol-lactonase
MSAVRLHAVTDGPEGGPPLLLLGSLGSTVAMWDRQLPVLAERFRVVRADHRGHGGSPVPPGPYALDDLVADVVLLLDALEISRASVVGLSLGGMVAMRLASLHPERVDRLALLCTSAGFGDPESWTTRAAQVRAHGIASLADAVISRWFTPDFARREPAAIDGIRQSLRDTSAEGYAGCCEAIGQLDLHQDLSRITAPTLVLAGAEDPSTTPAVLQVIADGIPGARLAVVPGAHLANVESASEVNAVLVSHFSSTQGQA